MGRKILFRALFVVNLAFALSYAGMFARLAVEDEFWRVDFTALWVGWRLAWERAGATMYDLATQGTYTAWATAGRWLSPVGPPGEVFYLYLNPPQASLLFAPLAALPRGDAFWVWSAIELAALVWALWRLLRLADWTREERALLATGVLGFPPVFWALQQGALSLLMLLGWVELFCSLAAGRNGRAGWWAAWLTLKPQHASLAVAMLLGARRVRALGATLVITAAGAAAAGAALGWDSWPGFVKLARFSTSLTDGAYSINPAAMYNLRGTLVSLLGSQRLDLANSLGLAALIVGAGVTIWLWWGRQRVGRLRFAGTVALSALTSLHFYPQDAVILVLPAVLGYAALRERTFGAFVLSMPLLFWLEEAVLHGALGIRLPVLVELMLIGWLALALWSRDEGMRDLFGRRGRRLHDLAPGSGQPAWPLRLADRALVAARSQRPRRSFPLR